MITIRPFLKCTAGAAAAEMALIAPLAIVMLFGFFEAGHYFYAEHQVVKGVRDGARFGARQRFNDVNCRSGTPYISSAVASDIKSVTRTGMLQGGTSRVSGWVDANITVSVTCPTTSEATTGLYTATEQAPQVNVAASVNYDSLFNGLGIITNSAKLNASQQATVMGI